jgi:hypothetical protein
MTFVLRGTNDLDLGPTFAVLGAIGRLSALVPKSEEADFAEFLGLIETNEEPVSDMYVARLVEQAGRLAQRAAGSEDVWLLERLQELRVKDREWPE